jgi:hypothetical protein
MGDDIDLGKLSDREILVLLASNQKTVHGRLNDHGQRLRFLEGVAKTATGAAAVVGFVIGWFKINASVK